MDDGNHLFIAIGAFAGHDKTLKQPLVGIKIRYFSFSGSSLRRKFGKNPLKSARALQEFVSSKIQAVNDAGLRLYTSLVFLAANPPTVWRRISALRSRTRR
jgi:hypothetical protein